MANRAFVLRANVDLASLAGSATAPTASPTNGTYWFDIASSVPGLFEWSKADQAFTTITPTYITSITDLVGDHPQELLKLLLDPLVIMPSTPLTLPTKHITKQRPMPGSK